MKFMNIKSIFLFSIATTLILIMHLLLTTPYMGSASPINSSKTTSFALNVITTKYCAVIASVLKFSSYIYENSLEHTQQLSAPAELESAQNKQQLISIYKEYIVQPGDSLYGISRMHGITVQKLISFNGLNSTIIHPGQVLNIPNNLLNYDQIISRASDVGRSRISYTEKELDLLSRLISAEAQGEPYTAQVAVGAVVINRVLSPKFPNTIKGVIYQKGQFGPVRNGYINRPAASSSISAAKEALYGKDPTNGALFFTDTSSMNRFFHQLPVAYRDGRMVFFYSK